MKKLEGKVAVVTGAASGIGKATAELFVEEGAKVVGVDLCEGSMAEMEKAMAGNFTAFYGDISLRETNEKMIDKAVEVFGKVDILINNAGIADKNFPVDHIPDAVWDKVIKVNLYGPMYAMRYFTAKKLENGESGSIVSTSSVGGNAHPMCVGSAYAASKAALIQLTKHVAYSYRDNGIRCNAICVGGCKTNIVSTLADADEIGTKRSMDTNAYCGRISEPHEIAETMLFLASDDASFINGAIVNTDGGWSCL